MKKIDWVLGIIICMGSLLSGCDFRMSVKDRTGETQTYTADSVAVENTLPLQVVKYKPMDIYQIGKMLYDMSKENVNEYLQGQGKDPLFYLSVSTNGEGFYTINGELGDYYTTVLGLFSNEFNPEYYFSHTSIGDISIDTIEQQIEQRLSDAGFIVASCEKYALNADGLNQLQKDVYDKNAFKLYAPGAEVNEKGMQTGELNSWGEDDEAYMFNYYMAYGETYVDSVLGTNRIQIVYSLSKQEIVYGRGSVCPILTQEIISSKKVDNIDKNEAIALAKKALSGSEINNVEIISAEPVYVNLLGNISFENQTMTLLPAWRVEYMFEQNGKNIKSKIHLDAETGEIYDNTSKL